MTAWSHVARLNFKTSRVGVYKCLSLIVGFAVTVAIWQREVVSCRDFFLCAVATFWAMLLVGIYPGKISVQPMHICFDSVHIKYLCEKVRDCRMHNKCMGLYINVN